MTRVPRFCLGWSVLLAWTTSLAFAQELSQLVSDVLTKEQRSEASGMIDRDISRRSAAANALHRAEWAKIASREQWEAYRDERIARLRRSLAEFPEPPAKLNWRVTGTVEGDGYRIENVVYESRPGMWVTGNLYGPAKPAKSMPGLLIAHAHHRDKPQSEMQDMGMTWGRAGCLVLVIDQVGYGERRSHPFHRAEDYPKPFPTSRQDYRFRYDSGIQLQLLGDSLMGWMAWDLMRGVDLLLARDGIDPQRIILLGAVAGGGDPAGVTAALDRRITGCVPFNFGGPQPESRYPLPNDAEQSFNLLGGSYWESTRGLRLGGRDDFFHWVIVGSTAPRRLIHAHEFSWDGERDPAWRRYRKVWGEFYGAADNLGVAHGKGTLKQQAPAASHCTNIGRFHRQMIHPLFDRWFGIRVTDADEYSAPRKLEELICLTEPARRELQPRSQIELMTGVADERIARARKRLAGKSPEERRRLLREDWSRWLGPVSPAAPTVTSSTSDPNAVAGAKVDRVVLEVEPGIVVPLLVLRPAKANGRAPVVVGVAQAGKAAFVKDRAADVQQLVEHGALVVLPDLRGTGESRSGTSRGLDSGATNASVNLQLFGETLVGQRLRDLRSVLAYVRTRPDADARRIALWGDSFAAPNSADTNFRVPRSADVWPRESEPLGGVVSLLGALFEDDVKAVYVAGGLQDYRSVLTYHAVLIPHDASVPGALTTGDLADLAGGLTPRPLRFEALVDHLNRSTSLADVEATYRPTRDAYGASSAALSFSAARTSPTWLLESLRP